eukprot:5551772-Lingulodinium_polyedra.AAC.1
MVSATSQNGGGESCVAPCVLGRARRAGPSARLTQRRGLTLRGRRGPLAPPVRPPRPRLPPRRRGQLAA